MSQYVVKPNRGDDFYVEWFTGSDTPIAFGTRQDFQEESDEIYSDERFERVDLYGSSAYNTFGRWQQDVFWIGRSWEIPRENLKPFVLEAYEASALDFWAASCKEVVEKYCKPLVFDD